MNLLRQGFDLELELFILLDLAAHLILDFLVDLDLLVQLALESLIFLDLLGKRDLNAPLTLLEFIDLGESSLQADLALLIVGLFWGFHSAKSKWSGRISDPYLASTASLEWPKELGLKLTLMLEEWPRGGGASLFDA